MRMHGSPLRSIDGLEERLDVLADRLDAIDESDETAAWAELASIDSEQLAIRRELEALNKAA